MTIVMATRTGLPFGSPDHEEAEDLKGDSYREEKEHEFLRFLGAGLFVRIRLLLQTLAQTVSDLCCEASNVALSAVHGSNSSSSHGTSYNTSAVSAPPFRFGGAFAYPVFYTCVASGIIYWQRAILSIIMVKGLAQDFELSTYEQGEVLSAFFVGYILGGFTASRVLQRNPMPYYLPNFILKCSLVSSAVCTLYIAVLAKTKAELEYARLITGIGQGFFFPSCYVLLAQVVESPGRKTTALGRMGAATPGAVALTYFVSAEIPEWHHATAMSALSAVPLVLCMIFSRAENRYFVSSGNYEVVRNANDDIALDDFAGTATRAVMDHGNNLDPLEPSTVSPSNASSEMDAATGSTFDATTASIMTTATVTATSSIIGRPQLSLDGSSDPFASPRGVGREAGQRGSSQGPHRGMPPNASLAGSLNPQNFGSLRAMWQDAGRWLSETWYAYHRIDQQADWIQFAGDYVVPAVTTSPKQSKETTAGMSLYTATKAGVVAGAKRSDGGAALVGPPSAGGAAPTSTSSMSKSSATATTYATTSSKVHVADGQLDAEEIIDDAGVDDERELPVLVKNTDDSIRGMNARTFDARNATPAQVLFFLVSSKPFCAIMACHFCHNWCNFILLAWLPTFFGKKNVVMSAFPYLLCAIAAPIFPYYCERELAKRRDLWHVRRELAIVALLFPAILFTFMPFVHDHRTQSAMFSLILVCGAAIHSSVLAGPLDLAGESHVGTLLATTNMVGAIPGIVGVRAAAYFKESLGWEGVFISCALLYYVAIVIYLNFGSVKRLV
ncbi:unnamed protein product [Amoebophrya sp. A120]|nr:unnamed protein product [Amoebophrya sp. A120]|eukprot:GSA120T00023053001.1